MIDPIQVGPFSDHVTLLQVRTRRVSIPHRLVSIQTRFEPRPTQRNNERTCSYSAARPLKTRTIRAKQLLLINLERGGGQKLEGRICSKSTIFLCLCPPLPVHGSPKQNEPAANTNSLRLRTENKKEIIVAHTQLDKPKGQPLIADFWVHWVSLKLLEDHLQRKRVMMITRIQGRRELITNEWMKTERKTLTTKVVVTKRFFCLKFERLLQRFEKSMNKLALCSSITKATIP